MVEKIIKLGTWTYILEWVALSHGKSDLTIQQKARSASTPPLES